MQVNLDRFLVSPEWEQHFPLCHASCLTRLGSDHAPIMLHNGEGMQVKSRQFHFGKHWFLQEGFKALVIQKRGEFYLSMGAGNSLDNWQDCVRKMRKFLKGWGANIWGTTRKKKQELLQLIQELDSRSEGHDLTALEWRRYQLEEELIEVYRAEELYWQQKGEQRILEGDANTSFFFHAVANGRRRRCMISVLETDGDTISDKQGLKEHIYGFYKQLFGPEPRGQVRLADDFWAHKGGVSCEDNIKLTEPFTFSELENVVKSMKTNMAPGPDGFHIIFYKKFWGWLKLKGNLICSMKDFYRGELDLKCLNYGVISLIQKTREANNIKQFRPICLNNVSMNILTKTLAVRLGGVVDKVIGKTQTAIEGS